MPETFEKLENNHSLLTFTKNGGQVLSWKTGNQQIFYQGSSQKRTGIPILFPFANPLDNNIFNFSGKEIPQHGFARNSTWQQAQISGSICKLSLNDKQIDPVWQAAYPFKFKLSLILDISTENELKYKIQVQNLDSKDLPIAPGIHPYFPIKHEQKKLLKIIDKSPFILNSGGQEIQFPLGILDWENDLNGDFFTFNAKVLAKFPSGLNLEIEETSEVVDFRCLVIWSENKTMEDFNFVCLEPFSRITNGINNDPILVKPGEIWEKEICFRVL